MDFVSPEAEERYTEVVARASDLLVGLDFDGTLAPIVPDPETSALHPGAAEALVDLAARVRLVAVVTGRPAAQVVRLGGLEEIGDGVARAGREVWVLGQYGDQRWTSADRQVHSPEPPPGLASLRARLPELLAEADAADAYIEEKGLAVGVHTRRLPDPDAAYRRLLPVLTDAAAEAGLNVEQGRRIIELRGSGMDKGAAVRETVAAVDARAVLFAGDDLGDLPAFRAVADLRERDVAGLLVCSASAEQTALSELADVVVDGPAGTVELLRRLADDIAGEREPESSAGPS